MVTNNVVYSSILPKYTSL